MIEAPARIEASNVEGIVAEMERAYGNAPTRLLSLNMQNVDAITRPAGALLVNVLLTQLSKATLEVVAPAKSPVEKLTYSGLGFAFAHRKGTTSFQNLTESALQLDRWRLPWTPAQRRPDIKPVEPEGRGDPSFYFKAHAAFVNPHATPRRNHRRDVPYRAQGWLHSVLPPRAMGADVDGQIGFLQDLQALIYELVENVADHAWPVGNTEPFSLVQISVARGNEKDTRDRIWVVVMDTGPGIPATAAPKIDDPKVSHKDLMKGLLGGQFLQTHHRARGLGLPRVARICSRWRDSRLEIHTDNLRIRLDNGADVQITESPLSIKGTVITARFSTPPISAAGADKRE